MSIEGKKEPRTESRLGHSNIKCIKVKENKRKRKKLAKNIKKSQLVREKQKEKMGKSRV